MGQLLRGITVSHNPQIHTEEKSLTFNMAKHFAIKQKVFDLYGNKNKFVSWLYATGRVNMGAQAQKVMKVSESIHDNAYRIAYRGSLFVPAYSYGKVQFGSVLAAANMDGLTGVVTYTNGMNSTTIGHNVVGTVGVKHDPNNNIFGDKYNEGDAIGTGPDYEGPELIVMGKPVLADTGTHYMVNFKVNGKATSFKESHYAADELFPEAGNRFGEGSERGYQRDRKYKWRINYSIITRATLTMTGSSIKQKVAYIYNSETKAQMWEYEQVLDLHERHVINVELAARYAKSSMDPSSHKWFENYGTNKLTLDGFTSTYGIVAPVIGDGWIPQLDDCLTFGYDPNTSLPVQSLELMMTILAQRSPSGSTGNTFVMIGDKLGHMIVDRSFKEIIGFTSDKTKDMSFTNANTVFNVRTGESNKIGFTIDRYYYLENEYIFIEDELSNHPAFAPQNGGIVGTGTIFVINASLVNGVSNIDILSRSDRELRAKYIDGMHSLDSKDPNNTKASSGFDGARYDELSEILPIIYSTESCAKIKATSKFTGGALTGATGVGTSATNWHY